VPDWIQRHVGHSDRLQVDVTMEAIVIVVVTVAVTMVVKVEYFVTFGLHLYSRVKGRGQERGLYTPFSLRRRIRELELPLCWSLRTRLLESPSSWSRRIQGVIVSFCLELDVISSFSVPHATCSEGLSLSL